MLNITFSGSYSPEEKTGTNKMTTGTVSCYGSWMISSVEIATDKGRVEVLYCILDSDGGRYLGQVHMME